MARVIWNTSRYERKIRKALDQVEREGAVKIANDMKSKVPVDSGKLKSAITVKKSKYKNGGYIAGVFSKNDGKRWEDTEEGQAVFVEYGHATAYLGRNYRGRKNVVKNVPAQPFMRPSLYKNEARIYNDFKLIVKG